MSFVVSAVSAAIAIPTVASIATAVAAVGTAMTVVGTVTKSKELMKVGKVLAIGGGVTALGASLVSGLSSAATGAAGDAASSAVASDLGSESLWSDLASQQTADAAANVANSNLESLTADSFLGAASANPNSVVSSLGTGSSTLGGTAANESSKGLVSSALGESGNALPVNTESLQSLDSIGNVATSKTPGLGESIKDWWGKLKPEEKTRIGTAVLQAGGNAVGGLFQGWSAEQKLDLERQIRDEEQRRHNQGVKNANTVPVIRFQQPGLVNSVMGAK